MNICKYCNKVFDLKDKTKGWMANHVRWCDNNPKKIFYKNNMALIRKSITDESIHKMSIAIKKLHSEGKYDNKYKLKPFLGKKHTEESKEKMRLSALSSNHRRLRRKMIYYNNVLLDSTWELQLAKRLDEIKIKWIRPSCLKWKDKNGYIHNYFPDFYLPDYNLYLDPKNPRAYLVQKEKINCLQKQYDNIIFLTSLKDIINFAPVLALTSNQ